MRNKGYGAIGDRVVDVDQYFRDPDGWWGTVTDISEIHPDPAFCQVLWDRDPKQKPQRTHVQRLRTRNTHFDAFRQVVHGKGKYIDPGKNP
jgi:hypothetical protein